METSKSIGPEDMAVAPSAGRLAKLRHSVRYPNILASRNAPVLFVLICFLIIADTRCDQVGGTNAAASSLEETNDKEKTEIVGKTSNIEQDVAIEHQAVKQHHSATSKFDPLSMLREIYLDHNSKVITMLEEGDPVQKFHPNGRYGRRSVDNFAEPHAELGRIVLNEPASDPASGSMKTILHSLSRDFSGPGREGRLAVANRYSLDSEESRKGSPFYSSGAALANYQFEMNKLLKCNYTGVASLFWCDTNTNN